MRTETKTIFPKYSTPKDELHGQYFSIVPRTFEDIERVECPIDIITEDQFCVTVTREDSKPNSYFRPLKCWNLKFELIHDFTFLENTRVHYNGSEVRFISWIEPFIHVLNPHTEKKFQFFSEILISPQQDHLDKWLFTKSKHVITIMNLFDFSEQYIFYPKNEENVAEKDLDWWKDSLNNETVTYFHSQSYFLLTWSNIQIYLDIPNRYYSPSFPISSSPHPPA